MLPFVAASFNDTPRPDSGTIKIDALRHELETAPCGVVIGRRDGPASKAPIPARA